MMRLRSAAGIPVPGRRHGTTRLFRPAEQSLRPPIRSLFQCAGKVGGNAAQPCAGERNRLRQAAKAHHGRKLFRLADDLRSDPHAGLRHGVRRRVRLRGHQHQARQGTRREIRVHIHR